MAELLLELFSEEIPARMQARAADDLKGLLVEALTANGLKPESAESHSTPRRLAVVVRGVPAAQEDVREERRGPRADAPEMWTGRTSRAICSASRLRAMASLPTSVSLPRTAASSVSEAMRGCWALRSSGEGSMEM